jgi:uncharacterized protein (DUF2252 family)
MGKITRSGPKPSSLNQVEAPKAAEVPKTQDTPAQPAADQFETGGTRPPDQAGPNNAPLNVKAALAEDHAYLARANPEGLEAKMAKIEKSPFVFFRGTAGLFYRRVAELDQDKPKVLIAGDVHPENFGIMEAADGTLTFGLDDFDEAAKAPFGWDLRRGATGFALFARDRGLDKDAEEKIVGAFVNSYFSAMSYFVETDAEDQPQLTGTSAPAVLDSMFEEAKGRKRKKYLEKYVEDEEFKTKKKTKPVEGPLRDYRAAIREYLKNTDDNPGEKTYYTVKDVAERKGSGTASLGLKRYWVLIEGPSKSEKDDRILELKESRPSVVERFSPRSSLDVRLGAAAAAVHAHDVHRPIGDRFYGHTTIDGKEFLVRERSPRVVDPDFEAMDEQGMADYAAACALALAQAHARDGRGERPEKDILESAMKGGYAREVVDFSSDMADLVENDYLAFLDSRDDA